MIIRIMITRYSKLMAKRRENPANNTLLMPVRRVVNVWNRSSWFGPLS